MNQELEIRVFSVKSDITLGPCILLFINPRPFKLMQHVVYIVLNMHQVTARRYLQYFLSNAGLSKGLYYTYFFDIFF